VTETTVKKLLCCGFRRTDKAMGQVYRCWWRICREINVFSRFESHMFYVLYPFVTYLLTFPRNFNIRSGEEHNSIGIATSNRLDDRGSNLGRDNIFFSSP
jgi:hypothetical protein